MKRHMNGKKAAIAALAAALVMTSGCSSQAGGESKTTEAGGEQEAVTTAKEVKTPDEEIVIRVCWWGNQVRNDSTVKALDMYEEQHPGVKFEVEFSEWSGYWDKLATQAAGGNLADIIQMDYSYIKQYADKAQLAGLNQYIDSGVIDTANIAASIMASGEIDGEVYGICNGMNTTAMLVNTDIMEEAGVTMPKQPTYEEFFAAAKTIYEKTGQQIEIPSDDGVTMQLLARCYGQTLFNKEGNGLGMPDEKVALQYFTMLKDTLEGGYHLAPELMAEASTNQQSLLAAGKKWCVMTNSNQIISELDKCEDGLNWDIYMQPTMEDATQQPMFLKPSQFFSLSKDSKNPKTAADVINFLINSVEANQQALKGERGVPVSSVVADAVNEVVDEDTARINAYVSEVGKVATPVDPPYPPAFAEIGKNINDLSDMIRYGEISPEDAARQFYETSTELLLKGAK